MEKVYPCESFPSVQNPGGDDSMDFTKIKSASILTLAIELLSETNSDDWSFSGCGRIAKMC